LYLKKTFKNDKIMKKKFLVSFSTLLIISVFNSCCTRVVIDRLTIIIKIKDTTSLTSQDQGIDLNGIFFPPEFFKSQSLVKHKYWNIPNEIDASKGVKFINEIVNINISKLEDPSLFSTSDHKPGINWNKQVTLSPLFSNFEDINKVVEASIANNKIGRYVFTNLYNYLKVEFAQSDRKKIEQLLNDNISDNGKNFSKDRIIEYYYFANEVEGANLNLANTATPEKDYKQVLNIPNPNLGLGDNVKLIAFDEGVHDDPSSRWKTETTTIESDHGTMTMGVFFKAGTGLIPNSEALVVPSKNGRTSNQYSQFLHALASALNSSKRLIYPILLVEVHTVVGVGGKVQKFPIDIDPAMFFLTRLGSFGLNLIIVEVGGNGGLGSGGLNLDTVSDTSIIITGLPLSEFLSFNGNTALLSSLGIGVLQVDTNNATQGEIDSNLNFVSGFTNTKTWLPIWRRSPSGAIMIAGYNSNTFNCNTNYGSKITIIGPGYNVPSFIYDGRSRSYTSIPFSGSSSATAVVTGIIASALSIYTSSTAGQIKNALYNHPSSNYSRTYPANNMKVPNVQNFYTYLSGTTI